MTYIPETPKAPITYQMSALSEPTESREDRYKLTPTERVLLGIGLVFLAMIGGFFVSIKIARARISANEGSAIGTLRTMATSQAQYQSCAQVDQDADGTGEHALLGELAGTISRRGAWRPGGSYYLGAPANPTFITPVLGPQDKNPWGGKSGYHFQIFLAGKKQCTTDQGTTNPVPLRYDDIEEAAVINVQETKWRGYAWPISPSTGTRCFGIDQQGEVLVAPNTKKVGEETEMIYQGESRTPTHDAAAEAADQPETMESNFKGNVKSKDGQVWTGASI